MTDFLQIAQFIITNEIKRDLKWLLPLTVAVIYFLILVADLLSGFIAGGRSFPSFLIAPLENYPVLLWFTTVIVSFVIAYYVLRAIRLIPIGFSLTLDKKENFSFRNLRRLFNVQGFLQNEYEGKPCIYLRKAPDGMISKKTYKNYELTFDCKIQKRGFGIVLCARDPENYCMLRVDNEGVVPHMRKAGWWDPQAKCVYKNNANIQDKDIKFTISVCGRNISLEMEEDQNIVCKFDYLVPDYFPMKISSGDPPQGIVERVFTTKRGRFGFRVHGDQEEAIIWNLNLRAGKCC